MSLQTDTNDAAADFHHTEGMSSFTLQSLSEPYDPKHIARAKTFSAMCEPENEADESDFAPPPMAISSASAPASASA